MAPGLPAIRRTTQHLYTHSNDLPAMTNTTLLSRPAAHASRFARTAARLTAAPLLLAALAACGEGGDDGIGPGNTGPSNVAFGYTGSGPQGSIQGTYQALGDPDRLVPQLTQTYALGQRVAGEGVLRVMSNVARPGQRADFSWVIIPRLTVGSVTIDGTCPGETCAAVSLAIDVSAVGVSQARYSCALDSGTIRIFSISDGRAVGEFSGTGSCIGAPGTEDLDEFIISGGTFDVKVIDVPS
jgi:hypothetical protein